MQLFVAVMECKQFVAQCTDMSAELLQIFKWRLAGPRPQLAECDFYKPEVSSLARGSDRMQKFLLQFCAFYLGEADGNWLPDVLKECRLRGSVAEYGTTLFTEALRDYREEIPPPRRFRLRVLGEVLSASPHHKVWIPICDTLAAYQLPLVWDFYPDRIIEVGTCAERMRLLLQPLKLAAPKLTDAVLFKHRVLNIVARVLEMEAAALACGVTPFPPLSRVLLKIFVQSHNEDGLYCLSGSELEYDQAVRLDVERVLEQLRGRF